MLLRRMRRTTPDGERGSAMVAVLGVLLVVAVVSVGLVSSSIASAGFSTSSRANVQSRAAADAGVDVAFAAIYRGSYNCAFASADLNYSASVAYRAADGSPIACAASTGALPSSSSPVAATVTSVGTADAPAVAGNSSQDTATVVAEIQVVKTVTTTPGTSVTTYKDIAATGAAIYSYSGATFAGHGAVASTDPRVPEVVVKTGNATCTGGTQSTVSNFVVASGSLTMSGSCEISGNVWAWTRLDMLGESKVQKDAVTPVATQSSKAKIHGTHYPAVGPGTPYSAWPKAGEWVDFAYRPSDWGLFAHEKVTGSECGYAAISQALTRLGSARGVIDATGCGAVAISGNQLFALKADLAIIANKITFSGGTGFTADGPRRLWLINPDAVADAQPTCVAAHGGTTASSVLSVGGGFVQDQKISMLLYSPCKISIASGTVISGQVYGGEVATAGGSSITYRPVGLPGWDLATGTATPTSETKTTPGVSTTTYSAALKSRLEKAG